MTQYTWTRRPPTRIGVRRVAATGSIVVTILFIGSWLATHVPGSMGFMYVRMFTYAAPASLHALVEGLVWSSLLGFSVGFLTAITYNAIGQLDQVPDISADEDIPSQGHLDAAWRHDKHIGVVEALRMVEDREKRAASRQG